MRERIARAIDPLAWSLTAFDLTPNSLANYQEANRPTSLSKADAVLEALREPDVAMIDASTNVLLRHFGEPTGSMGRLRRIALEAHEAVIDAARTKESV